MRKALVRRKQKRRKEHTRGERYLFHGPRSVLSPDTGAPVLAERPLDDERPPEGSASREAFPALVPQGAAQDSAKSTVSLSATLSDRYIYPLTLWNDVNL